LACLDIFDDRVANQQADLMVLMAAMVWAPASELMSRARTLKGSEFRQPEISED